MNKQLMNYNDIIDTAQHDELTRAIIIYVDCHVN